MRRDCGVSTSTRLEMAFLEAALRSLPTESAATRSSSAASAPRAPEVMMAALDSKEADMLLRAHAACAWTWGSAVCRRETRGSMTCGTASAASFSGQRERLTMTQMASHEGRERSSEEMAGTRPAVTTARAASASYDMLTKRRAAASWTEVRGERQRPMSWGSAVGRVRTRSRLVGATTRLATARVVWSSRSSSAAGSVEAARVARRTGRASRSPSRPLRLAAAERLAIAQRACVRTAPEVD
mmetsp:Transcript_54651/g.150480  ORF Transcript_54651/g.150480 Transcript_54651/m.150480 type:complete len:242 (+) Transcript_54651:461-1186(+)